ncbi:STK19 kinase, partial [Menura novaehollandiae]|nr:STK19 kinase [Menura novaehollandiae]
APPGPRRGRGPWGGDRAPPVTPFSPGRRALLALVRRSRHREVPLWDLQRGKAPPGTRLGVPFLLHDLLGAQELQSVPTTTGPLLRLAEP